MRKLLVSFIALAIIFSFGGSPKIEAASSANESLDQEAKVSEQVYSLLQERAGFAAYIYMDRDVDLDPINLAGLTIEEREDDYFIGYFYEDSNKVLVTKDGLVVAFTPKDYAHTIFPSNRHLFDVQIAVKSFMGLTITQVNYINFASPESDKAFSYYEDKADKQLFIPGGTTINHIAYSQSDDQKFEPGSYQPILKTSLESGKTHTLSNYGKSIDGIPVTEKEANAMSIFYTGDAIDVQSTGEYTRYNLTNNFVIDDTLPPLESIRIVPTKTSMALGEKQTVSLLGIYTDNTERIISSPDIVWTSSKDGIATISSGIIEALAVGETTLIATYDGKMDNIVIEVQDYKELPKKVNQPADKVWNIKFSGPVDITTLKDDTVFVTDSKGNEIPTIRDYFNDGKEFIVTLAPNPNQNYTPGESYTVWVKDIQSRTGQALKQYTKMDFTIKK